MTVILLVILTALIGVAALAGAIACLSAQRGLSLRAENSGTMKEEATLAL